MTDGPLEHDAHTTGLRRAAELQRQAAAVLRKVGEPELAQRADALASDVERPLRADEVTAEFPLPRRPDDRNHTP